MQFVLHFSSFSSLGHLPQSVAPLSARRWNNNAKTDLTKRLNLLHEKPKKWRGGWFLHFLLLMNLNDFDYFFIFFCSWISMILIDFLHILKICFFNISIVFFSEMLPCHFLFQHSVRLFDSAHSAQPCSWVMQSSSQTLEAKLPPTTCIDLSSAIDALHAHCIAFLFFIISFFQKYSKKSL